MKYSRIMRFRNDRIAKFFANNHGGIYKGWIEGETVFTIKRVYSRPISSYDKGCYIVVWEK